MMREREKKMIFVVVFIYQTEMIVLKNRTEHVLLNVTRTSLSLIGEEKKVT